MAIGSELQKDLIDTGWIHRPLPLRDELSLEAECAKKRVLQTRPIDAGKIMWLGVGPCSVSASPERTPNGEACVRLAGIGELNIRPKGYLEEGDCSNYGGFSAAAQFGDENWEAYNRVTFCVRPLCKGIRKASMHLLFRNEGKEKIPDRYNRDGYHQINLTNGVWNTISVEIAALPRDCVTQIAFDVSMHGCETLAELGDALVFDIGGIALEAIERPEPFVGWSMRDDEIAVCGSGYRPNSPKIAVSGALGVQTFDIINEGGGEVVFSGRIAPADGFDGLYKLDFTAFADEGVYRIRAGDALTEAFPISNDAWLPSAWKVINFLFTERCGYPVPGVHQTCHRDICALHAGKKFIYNGGWHDAGDVSQQTIQSAEVAYSLFELAASLAGDELHPLRERLTEEALWGLDYILKSRFGDGFRATSVGVSMWSQGFIGDTDDITARVHNNAYENFLCAGVEAYAGLTLCDTDPELASRSIDCAKSDFRFAQEKFAHTGFEERPPSHWEHSYMTTESALQATVCWSASLLFKATGCGEYAQAAVRAAEYAMDCQQIEPAGSNFPEGGFFWRNPERISIVHFSHQARDQIYMQALTLLCETQPTHNAMPRWRDAIQRHAQYLKRLFEFASPYGMMPAGVYRLEETQDLEYFRRQHLLTGDEALEEYARQLAHGVDIGGGYYLRHFPVWFSFKGNNAVLLSMAKSAALCGRFLNDPELIAIAERQLQWNIGVNPFRQSLMYGEGRRYAQQYAPLPGESVGELPVGIQTRGNEDVPFWPQMNNATYKEVWTTPAGRWLSVLASLQI
ncbi:MAG: glycoside hydrolase family 9 protein [Oscillospiraceae bacterium]|nr:glycoside hydrolase family 9 protein [Oscillospiraceae bacterium]